MKILQVAPYFIPYSGGQEKYIHNLSKYLSKMGHTVHVITSNYPKGKTFEEIDGITVERHNVLVRILRNPIAPGFLKIKQLKNNFDVVHIHNEHSFSSLLTAYFKLKNNLPLILTNHGQLQFDSFLFDSFEKIYNKSIGRCIFKICDKIVALSHSDAKYISSFGTNKEKIIILPNAIDIEEFQPYISKSCSDFLQKYKIDGKKIILFVGQIIPRKGIEYLIKSIKYIMKMHSEKNIVCLIIGKGEAMKKMKKIVKKLDLEEFIIFTGEITLNELVSAYESADVYVLPSLSEGLPTTILEALYFGLPVVATDIPGIRDHFKDFALLVPPRDETELAKALIKLLNDQDLANTLSKNGKELVATNYTWNVVAGQHIEVYKNLISDKFKRSI